MSSEKRRGKDKETLALPDHDAARNRAAVERAVERAAAKRALRAEKDAGLVTPERRARPAMGSAPFSAAVLSPVYESLTAITNRGFKTQTELMFELMRRNHYKHLEDRRREDDLAHFLTGFKYCFQTLWDAEGGQRLHMFIVVEQLLRDLGKTNAWMCSALQPAYSMYVRILWLRQDSIRAVYMGQKWTTPLPPVRRGIFDKKDVDPSPFFITADLPMDRKRIDLSLLNFKFKGIARRRKSVREITGSHVQVFGDIVERFGAHIRRNRVHITGAIV